MLTSLQLARAAGCSTSTVVRLARAGKLPMPEGAGFGRGSRHHFVGTKEDLVKTVHAHVTKHGWRKRTRPNGPAPRTPPPSAIDRDTINQVLTFSRFSQVKRDALMALAERFSDSDLVLLTEL